MDSDIENGVLKLRHVFVYGTLMGNGMRRILGDELFESYCMGNDWDYPSCDHTVYGAQLYQSNRGWFPMLRLTGDVNDVVKGEVFTFYESGFDRVLAVLDRYEGVASGLYRRVSVEDKDYHPCLNLYEYNQPFETLERYDASKDKWRNHDG